MNNIQQQTLNAVMETHFQFQKQFPNKHSLLFDEIKDVLECSLPMSEKFASTHCNMVSFWGLNYSQSKTNMLYSRFFDNMLENQYCNKEGFIKVAKDSSNSKSIICDEIFGFKYDEKYFEDYEDVLSPLIRLNKTKGYQLKMKGDTSGFHFIACYIDADTNILMGSDTSYRGTPFIVSKKITKNNFVWLLEV